jgi:hypothetical protein
MPLVVGYGTQHVAFATSRLAGMFLMGRFRRMETMQAPGESLLEWVLATRIVQPINPSSANNLMP